MFLTNAGGITKKGKGTLTLTAANTFAGTVTVEDGSLIAQNEDALPKSEFDLNITGGVLDGGGYTWKFGDVNVSSGSLDNVVGGTASSLTKTGAGKFAIEGNMEIAGPIRVLEGSLQLPLVGAGLWESARTYEDDTVRGQEFNALSTTPLRESVSTTLEFLYSNGVSTSRWRDHMNVFYSGYIWNTNDTAQTWTFAGVMDDGIKLIIDGNVIFSNTGWETPKAGKITVEPGPHRIFISMYNGTGGAGAKGTSYYSWPKNHGLVWAPVGEPVNPNDGLPSTNYVDYVDFCNPVNGAVLSLTRDGYESADVKETSVEVAAGAEVVVGDGAYAFANFKGLGNINGSTSIKTWVIDVNEIVAGAQMQVTGNLTFPEGAVFEFENDEMLPTDGKTLVIGHADGAITGRLPSVHIDGSGNWSIFASGHDLKLCKQNGTVMILR